MATDYAERKRRAVEYLKENGIPKCLENLLNTVINDNPNDLFGYMAEYFDGLAKSPTIANVVASEILSARGYPSFEVKIDGLVNGAVQGFSSLSAPVDSKPSTDSKSSKGKTPVPASDPKSQTTAEHPQTDKENDHDHLTALVGSINNEIKLALTGYQLLNQQEVDGILENIITKRTGNAITTDRNDEIPEHDDSLPNDEQQLREDSSPPAVHLDTLTVSLSIAVAASQSQRKQLYHHLYLSANNKEPSSLCLPTPIITVLGSGKKTPGKLYIFKQVMIFTKQDMVSLQALKQLTSIFQELRAIVQQKTPAIATGEYGALTPAMDRPEQALDLIREAVAAAGYNHENDISVALRCASSDVYDKDKQKYEICTNTFKSSEELVNNVYGDLCERYPEIKLIVDPLVTEDTEGWSKLNEKIRDKCFIIHEQSFANKRDLLENIMSAKLISGIATRVQDSSTVTQFLKQAKTIKDQAGILVVSPNDMEGPGKYTVDMAVAAEVDFMILGAPVHSEHIEKYNRLIAIERHLMTTNTFLQKQPLVPSPLADPTADEKQNGENAS